MTNAINPDVYAEIFYFKVIKRHFSTSYFTTFVMLYSDYGQTTINIIAETINKKAYSCQLS